MGKATNRLVHDLLGGAVRDSIECFGFAQDETADEIALDADQLAKPGCEVIYVKVGRDNQLYLEIVEKGRLAIGAHKRRRLDPNEHWSPIKASRMIRKLAEYDIEFIEQPTNAESLLALAQVLANSPIAIADDLIVPGLHETGGLARFSKIAHIAEAAGVGICLHGLSETMVTTCVANQVGSTISNLDDGNQYMNHFLSWDIIKSPNLTLIDGKLAALKGPGLGFEIDSNAVEEAAKFYQHQINA